MINTIPLPLHADRWIINQESIPRNLQAVSSFVAKVTISNIVFLRNDGAVVNLHCISSRYMRFMNRKYRNIDKTTNVLSFQADALPDDIEGITRELGDIFLCLDIIKQEAIEANKKFEDHWAHMIVHGILHLAGYDHANDIDAAKMENKEILILRKLGVDNPYHEEWQNVVESSEDSQS